MRAGGGDAVSQRATAAERRSLRHVGARAATHTPEGKPSGTWMAAKDLNGCSENDWAALSEPSTTPSSSVSAERMYGSAAVPEPMGTESVPAFFQHWM